MEKDQTSAKKILVVLSNPEYEKGLCPILERGGYALRTVDDREVSCELIANELPDIVVIGTLMLSKGDADRFAAIVNDCKTAEIPIILCGNDEAANASLKKLVDDIPVLHRPFCEKDVRYKMESQMKIRRLSQDLNCAHQKILEKEYELRASNESAAHIQRSLFPKHPPIVRSFRFAWHFMPCQKKGVGGDLFNILQLDERYVMAYVLDVSGHGFPAAMVTVSISQALGPKRGDIVKRGIDSPPYYQIVPTSEVMAQLNHEYPFERFDKFFTICYFLMNVKTGQVCYSNAAHPLPLLLRKDGGIEQLQERGTIIGLDNSDFPEGEVQLQPGDRIFMYTDGIVEHENKAGEFFGQERLCRQLRESQSSSIKETCDEVVSLLVNFGDGREIQDDVTLLGIEYLGR